MDAVLAEKVINEWLEAISREIPQDVIERLKANAKKRLTGLFPGEKTPEEFVNEIDEGLVEIIIRKGCTPSVVDRS